MGFNSGFKGLNFIRPVKYLHFRAWFMKNVLFEEKKIQSSYKRRVLENETEILQQYLKMQ